MGKKSIDDEDKEKALKNLIKETVSSAGTIAPDESPQKVKDRIRRQASGELDVDDYVKEAKKRDNKKR